MRPACRRRRRPGPASANGWRKSAAPEPGKVLKSLIAASPKVEALLTRPRRRLAISMGSGRRAIPRVSLRILDANPDEHFAALLNDSARAVAATKDEDKAMRLLRRMKSEAALLIALADIGGVWPVMRTTRALTELADTAVSSAVGFLLRDAATRGRFKPRNAAAAGARLGLHRARDGQDGRLRAQLFERHRSHRVLRARNRRADRRRRGRGDSTSASPAGW